MNKIITISNDKIIIRPKDVERFHNGYSVDKTTGCWNWVKALKTDGYGCLGVNNKIVLAHRLSYAIYVGDPVRWLCCHHCDNRRCVNYSHLFLSTAKGNQLDMKLKDRSLRGESNPASKLTKSEVERIRIYYGRLDITHRELANHFGVSRVLIGYIINYVLWK